MKKILKIFILFLLLYNSSILAQTNIAVFDLQSNSFTFRDDASTLTDRLRIELHKTGKFKVVERKFILDILKEQGFQQTGVTSNEYAVKVGRILEVKQIVIGSVGVFSKGIYSNTYSINVRLISVETGNTLKTATYDYTGNIDQILKYGMKNIAYQLAGLRLNDGYNSYPSKTYKNKPSYTKKYSTFRTTVGIEWGIVSHFRNGNYTSIWLGGSDNEIGVRFRGLYAQKDIPQVFYRDGFGDGRVNDAYGLFLDFSQGNFSGLWGGIGINYLEMVVGHEEESEKTDYELVSLAFSLGAMGKLISNLYINLWIDLHLFIIGDKEFKVGNHPFVHDDGGIDFSIALGWHF